MGRNTQALHSVIGDYMREIEKIERLQGAAKKMTKTRRIQRIIAFRKKIRQAAIKLQKMSW